LGWKNHPAWLVCAGIKPTPITANTHSLRNAETA
jgi:hypothetical protein